GFFAMPMPAQPLGWFKKKINSADDMKGLKYRTVGLATDIMQGMGMKVTQLPGGEIVPAMERGVIEAFEFNNPTSDMEFGAQDVAKYYYLSSYHQAIEYFEIIFNKTKFNSLPAEQQAILEYSAEAANTANYGLAMDRYSSDLQKLKKDHGVNVFRTDEEILKQQLASWDKVMEGLMEDAFFKKVVDSQKAWAHRVAYYDLLASADFKLAFNHHFPKELGF
ncbi:MAG: TRAP transporter substrate-binding protein DctP, partial [Rhodospirillales bacterium]|nr:TRAP transporter substrate-binding protein DctP [Rhodospirillales bacterium]